MSKLSTLKQEAYQAGKKKNWAQAIMLYEQILELDKNNPTVINELGDLCLKGGETRRSIGFFLNAAAKYRSNGLLNNAVAIYKKILRYDAENLHAHWYLAETRAGQGFIVEGENHAVHFLDHSAEATGDIKEIYLKRCQGLFELFPRSRVILSRLSQIFHLWSLALEAARADCLLVCMDFEGGKEAEARKAIDVLTAKTPELMNYPEFTKWNSLANPDAVPARPTFADFGSVSLDPEADSNEPALPLESSFADLARTAPGGSFGDLDIGGGPVAPKTPAAEAIVPAAAPTPAMTPSFADDGEENSAFLQFGTPTAKELDDEGCFAIDADEVAATDFDGLIAEASSGLKQSEPADELLSVPSEPAHSFDSSVGAAAAGPAKEEKVDLLAQMLEEDGPDLVAEASGELATITSEIGAVVGGGDGDDADRLYEMGMVYLEMGMFDQACTSFETAAADDDFSVRAHEMWGITLQRANRPDEAVAVLTRGLDFAAAGSRERHGLMYHLGMAMEKTGETDRAIDCFRQINDADPSYLDVGRRLARLTAV